MKKENKEKMPHEIKSEETKRKIMEAAKRLLSEHDFKYLTVRNICEESGAAYGSFYHHFESKENLLYLYTSSLYENVCAGNPLPDWIDRADYIKTVLWYMVVYGFFCEAAGRDLIRYLYENCPQEMFRHTMEADIGPSICRAAEGGYINNTRDRKYGRTGAELLTKDIEILCKGTVYWWCCNPCENEEPLHETLEHLAFNALFSFTNEKYRTGNFPHLLVTEFPQFEGAVNIPDLGFAHDERRLS